MNEMFNHTYNLKIEIRYFKKYWDKSTFDSNGNEIYYLQRSDGYWFRKCYDSDDNLIYYEDRDGIIDV